MPSRYPRKIKDQIQWFESRLEYWMENAAELGLTEEQVGTLQTLTQTAREAWFQAEQARMISRDATLTQSVAIQSLATFGSALLSTIKAKAETTKETSVYVKASIAPPAVPSGSGLPEMPTNLTASMDTSGGVNLKWEGKVPRSTFFTIWRRLDHEANFSFVGSVGAKKWRDDTVPAGSIGANYYVQAHRGEKVGIPSQQIRLPFGGRILPALSKAA